VSVPGEYATREAWKALHEGLHVQIFSDNVALSDEQALKAHARETDRLVMGPDCGTAIVNGVPLGFANDVDRGPVGVVAAAGTGLQEVTSLVDRAGAGISQAIGTGGRDLQDEVGAITT
jgi:succinyl-CoA synthetase alpha subunit